VLHDLPDALQFERHMGWVRDWFNVLPLSEAIDALFAGRIAPRALAITFDDGYADNEEVAAPILHRLGLPATFFVATGYLNGSCMWNDRVIEAVRSTRKSQLDLIALQLGSHSLADFGARRAAIDALLAGIKHAEPRRREELVAAIEESAAGAPAPRLMMSDQQVRALRSMGMEIGAHTVSHPILARLDAAAAKAEIGQSKEMLQGLLREPVDLFAYPNGVPMQDYGVDHAAMARQCGFSAAVSTAWGAASMRSDRFQLPRFTPWDRTRLRYGVRLVANYARREDVAA
jgi:peptidoglycan/xylan/chitin deacetylase (PgdA/CDA1 family)